MAYRVDYHTLAILPDGKIGNIRQESGHVYTDCKIEEIPAKLNEFLEQKKRVAVIQKVENVGGACI